MSRCRSRGGLEVVPGGYGAVRGGSRRLEHNPQQTSAALAPVRDGSVPRAYMFPALIRGALGLLERRAGHEATQAALVAEVADLPGEVKRSAPASAEPPWPAEPLTESEIRVLRYLPTHMGAPEMAAKLFVSANTVKTHLRHLYRKLGAHSRQEAVQRAWAVGLLAASARRI